ncbi:MAG: hypothetical protein GQ583_08610 [Methyloprofundus sp.]|nr:hypothetical protein [Methyloprofundus sp.]
MKKSEPPLWVDVKQSKYLLTFIISVHSLAVLSSLSVAILMPFKLLLLMLVCDSLYFHLQRYKKAYYLFSLKYTTAFSWELSHNNNLTRMRILDSSVLTSVIIILHVEINKKHRNILVCRDAVSAEAYRQLLVTLKITARSSAGSTV